MTSSSQWPRFQFASSLLANDLASCSSQSRCLSSHCLHKTDRAKCMLVATMLCVRSSSKRRRHGRPQSEVYPLLYMKFLLSVTGHVGWKFIVIIRPKTAYRITNKIFSGGQAPFEDSDPRSMQVLKPPMLCEAQWCNGRNVGLATEWSQTFRLTQRPQASCVHIRASINKRYNLVRVKGQWRPMAGKVAAGLTSHWPWVTDFSGLSIYSLSKEDEHLTYTLYTHTYARMHAHTHTHTHGPLGFCLGLPRWAVTRKVKPIWIYWSER